MRKFVSLLLVLVMLVGAAAFSSANTHSTVFSLCDSSSMWGGLTGVEFGHGEGSYACVKGSARQGGVIIMSCELPVPIDATVEHYLIFDFYISDIRALDCNSQMQLEVTSSGTCDVEENTWAGGQIKELLPVNGWNRVKLDISGGGLNLSHVNYFRFYMLDIIVPDVEEVVVKFDNMYLTDGSDVIPQIYDITAEKGDYTAPEKAYDCYAKTVYGDVDYSGEITIADALSSFKNVAGIDCLRANEYVASDVDGDGNASIVDALLLFKRVAGIDNEPFAAEKQEEIIETETGIIGTHIVHTTYETPSAVVAVCDVIAFGADGNGISDDTEAFDFALTYAQLQGGGTVFVPAGIYRINGNLSIPAGVTLCGDKPFTENPEENTATVGTVLAAYNGRDDESGAPFIDLDYSSGLRNLSIWYPEQTADDIKPYPYTINKYGTGNCVSNVCLVNSYNGIYNDRGNNALQNYEYVYGTVLKSGIFINNNFDLCRVENVCFSPAFWAECGLGERQNAQTISEYMFENATAIETQRLDWTYFTDITVRGCKYAFVTAKSETGETNGHFYNIVFSDCDTGIFFNDLSGIGMIITCGRIEAKNPLVVSDTVDSYATFKNIEFISLGNDCVAGGTGTFGFDDCVFKGSAAAINAPQIVVTMQDCIFDESLTSLVTAAEGSKLINPTSKESMSYLESAGFKVIYDENEHTEDIVVDAVEYDYVFRMKPSDDNFVDLSQAPYSVMPDTADDISATLQQAIDDVYELGGGIVYVGGGRYRLETPIYVKPGVELRGSSAGPHHSGLGMVTEFCTDYGKDDENGIALINLDEYSGIYGFRVIYDKQGDGTDKPVTPCAYTIRGNGKNIYVYSVTICNPYRGADFATNKCDNHFVKNFDGAPLCNGITVGGGSVNGIVRDCHFNPHYNNMSNIPKTVDYEHMHNDAYVVKKTVNEVMFHNFVYAAKSGIALEEGADVYSIAHGTDAGTYSLSVSGELGDKCTFVNSQLVTFGNPDLEMYYIYFFENAKGNLSLIQTSFWGDPRWCVYSDGDIDVVICGGASTNSGSAFAAISYGRMRASGLICTRLSSFMLGALTENAKIYAFGNICLSPVGIARSRYNAVSGSDTNN